MFALKKGEGAEHCHQFLLPLSKLVCILFIISFFPFVHSFGIINWSSSSHSKFNFNMHDLSSYKEYAESIFYFLLHPKTSAHPWQILSHSCPQWYQTLLSRSLVKGRELKGCLIQDSAGIKDQKYKKISLFHQELEEVLNKNESQGVVVILLGKRIY